MVREKLEVVWEKLQNAQKRSERGWKTPCIGRPWQGLRRPVVDFERFFGYRDIPGPRPQQGARDVPAKTLRFRVYTFTPPWEGPVRAPWWGSRPALPGLHDDLCRSRSSGSFGLRVAVVEPSAKTLGFKGFSAPSRGLYIPIRVQGPNNWAPGPKCY